MQYKDREDAAQQLIPYLNKYRNEDVVVLAVPRGGVPVAFYIAKHFNFPIELLMAKKIGHPDNPEYAIGAVTLEDYVVDENQRMENDYMVERVKAIRENLEVRYRLFMGDHKQASFENKVLIIVDDGIATGYTILACIAMLKRKRPKKIVVAVPVAPPSTVNIMKNEVDDFICPYTPEEFIGVGYHYKDFSEVSDKEVVRLIKELKYF